MVEMTCPTPVTQHERVLLAHGEGLRLTRQLIRAVFLQHYGNPLLASLGDGAVLPSMGSDIAMTTDCYVVTPRVFPGGDIGQLAIHGTVNDLTCLGAIPRYASVGMIIEEGLPLAELQQIVAGIARAAHDVQIQIATGDTKVVPRGAADGLYLNVTGIGSVRSDVRVGMDQIQAGDRLIVTGPIAQHGVAIMAARHDLALSTPILSDSASLAGVMADVWNRGCQVRFLRDPTRGGVAGVLHEIVDDTGLTCLIDEGQVPITEEVRGVCELLGLNPLYVANEGSMLLVVSPEESDRVLACLRLHPQARRATIIGTLTDTAPPRVLVKGALGTVRILDEPAGAPLPRIC